MALEKKRAFSIIQSVFRITRIASFLEVKRSSKSCHSAQTSTECRHQLNCYMNDVGTFSVKQIVLIPIKTCLTNKAIFLAPKTWGLLRPLGLGLHELAGSWFVLDSVTFPTNFEFIGRRQKTLFLECSSTICQFKTQVNYL